MPEDFFDKMTYNLVIVSSEGMTAVQSYRMLKEYFPFAPNPKEYPYLMYVNVSQEKISRIIPLLEENLIYYRIEEFDFRKFTELPKPSTIGLFEIFIIIFLIMAAFMLYKYHSSTAAGYENIKSINTVEEEQVKAGPELKELFRSAFSLFSYNMDGSVTSGTGFFISEDGLALTACHVIENSASLEIQSEYYNTKRIEILHRDRYFDIAVLKTDQKVVRPIELASIKNASQKDTVYSFGNPYGISLMVSRGIISNLRNVFGGILYIQTDARIKQGSSGGPLLLPDGRCIGINTFLIYKDADLGLGFCIPVGYLGFISEDLLPDDLKGDYYSYKEILERFVADESKKIKERSDSINDVTQIRLSVRNNRQGLVFFEISFYNIDGIREYSGELNLEVSSGGFYYDEKRNIEKKDYAEGILRLEYSNHHPMFEMKYLDILISTRSFKKRYRVDEKYYN